jgi:hypothetical protein
MLPVLASEEDGAPTFNLDDRPVAKLDGVVDLGFELGEEDLGASYVVRGYGVEYPPAMIILLR